MMLDDLQTKVKKAGEEEDKAFKEFFDWCDDAASDAKHSIKDATKAKEKAEATISKMTADIEDADTSIAELAASIASADEELKTATELRTKEASEFAKVESELVEGVGMLDNAISIVSKAMGGSALLQQKVTSKNVQNVLNSVSTVLDAAAFSTNDRQKLIALVQSKDDDEEFGAPAAATYEGHSGGIVDVLEDMKDKAEGELADARKAETTAKHNYEMLKQSLEDQMEADTKDKAEATTTKAESEETKATAEGELASATKDLANGNSVLHTTSTDCMTSAQDHEVSQKGRAEELAALKKATEIIKSTTSGAAGQSYSFLQLKVNSKADLAKLEVVTAIKKLAKEQHSTALAQLASRISAAARLSMGSGEDVFAKIKKLITEMIGKLEKEAAAEADAKAYCDEETSKNNAKKAELIEDTDKLKAKIDQATSKSTKLKATVADLEKELAELASLQSEMDKMRADEKAAYKDAKFDLEKGVAGVGAALQVLRDYYGSASLVQQPSPPTTHSASGDAGGSIISMLEVAESDFSKNLAQITTEEDMAQAEYEKVSQENKMTKTMKEQDAKYSAAEAKSLDKTIAELSSDLAGEQTELEAVIEYGSKLDAQCIAKPETYEERKARREAEINGLKEALEVLETEAAFLQKQRRLRRGM